MAAGVAALTAVTSAAGTYGAAKSNKEQIEAQARAAANDRERQAALANESTDQVGRAIDRFTPETQKADITAAVANRTAQASPQAAPNPQQYQAGAVAAPVEVKSDLTRRFGDVASKAKEEAARQHTLAAFGDASTAENFKLGRIGENMRQLLLQSRGSTNVFPLQLAKTTVPNASQNAAGIFNTLGSIGSLYAKNQKPLGIGYGTAHPENAGEGYPY